MSNTRLESKIAKRKIADKSIKLGIKDNWYYAVILPDNGIEITACAEPINDQLKKIFNDKHAFIKVGKQSIYLIFEPPSTINQLPTAVYAGNNLYGSIAIVAMLDEVKLELAEALPLQTIFGVLDSLWFVENMNKIISIVL